MTEKKLTGKIAEVQKALFDFKAIYKSLPRDITTQEANNLMLNMLKCLRSFDGLQAGLYGLMKCIAPRDMREDISPAIDGMVSKFREAEFITDILIRKIQLEVDNNNNTDEGEFHV